MSENSPRIHLDANVILRFLRNDDARQSPAAARLFQKAAGGTVALFISAVTINEVFFAFTSSYKLSHPDTAGKLLPFIRASVVEFEHEDCLVDARAAQAKDLVASFDQDLKSFKDIQLYDLV